jgi:flavodoxin
MNMADGGERKALIAFYSFTGNCRELGRAMAGAVGGDVGEIVPRREIPRGVLAKYLKGGKASLFKETAELLPFKADPAAYRLVIVGTPVWFWNLPPASRGFLAGRPWEGIKAACYAMYRGAAGRALASMRELIQQGGGIVLGTEAFVDPRWRNAEKTRERAALWAREMLRAADGQGG